MSIKWPGLIMVCVGIFIGAMPFIFKNSVYSEASLVFLVMSAMWIFWGLFGFYGECFGYFSKGQK